MKRSPSAKSPKICRRTLPTVILKTPWQTLWRIYTVIAPSSSVPSHALTEKRAALSLWQRMRFRRKDCRLPCKRGASENAILPSPTEKHPHRERSPSPSVARRGASFCVRSIPRAQRQKRCTRGFTPTEAIRFWRCFL